MTPSDALQVLIVNRLKSYGPLADLIGGRVFDAPQDGDEFPYVSIGPSDVVEADADCIPGRIETVQIDCWHQRSGKIWPVKVVADQVKAALHLYAGEMADHALVEMRVDLMRAFMDPDMLTAHGVVQVSCIVEER